MNHIYESLQRLTPLQLAVCLGLGVQHISPEIRNPSRDDSMQDFGPLLLSRVRANRTGGL